MRNILHPNTIWLISWADRMVDKYGQPEEGIDWCRKLAIYMEEEGNDYPSNNALEVARRWEKHIGGISE